jgi:hypothetical protein
MKVLVILSVFLAVAAAALVPEIDHIDEQFGNLEELMREKILEGIAIAAHNKLFEQGKVSYRKALNKFSNMTEGDLKYFLNGFKMRNVDKPRKPRFLSMASVNVPSEKDWRNTSAVTSVKYQGKCGSCYAFSAIGAIEGQYFLKTGKSLSLSVQQVVDCSTENYGCKGGLPSDVFKYIAANPGLATEDSYFYRGFPENCSIDKKNAETFVEGYELLPESEEALMEAVANVGPISVGIYVSKSFLHYGGGIYDEPDCNGKLNHAVLVVGYGSENGSDYWIVKNSWGKDWGEKGFIRMARNKGNQCGIASVATYPTGVRGKEVIERTPSPTPSPSTSPSTSTTTTEIPINVTTAENPFIEVIEVTPSDQEFFMEWFAVWLLFFILLFVVMSYSKLSSFLESAAEKFNGKPQNDLKSAVLSSVVNEILKK